MSILSFFPDFGREKKPNFSRKISTTNFFNIEDISKFEFKPQKRRVYKIEFQPGIDLFNDIQLVCKKIPL